MSSVDTVGRVIIILSISRLKYLSNATCTANNVLPLPALPNIKLKGVANISAFACFYSADNDIENLILFFGGVLTRFGVGIFITFINLIL